MPEHRVVVIGAGVGGLVSALLLAARGLHVTLIETADGPGGKMRPVTIDGHPLDTGPTVFTMRWVFDELLREVGSSVEAAFPPLHPLAVLARHAWAVDGSGLDLFADRQQSADAIAAFACPADARRYLAFCEESAAVYRHLEGPYIRSGRPTPLGLTRDLGMAGLATLTGLRPFSSLASVLSRRFSDPRLRQLFGRYATYCGAAPGLAPSTLMLVAHVEQAGVWALRGGMAALAGALADLARERGAQLRYSTRCEAIELDGSRVRGVRLQGGERVAADSVIYNGDVSALPGLLPASSGLASDVVVPPAQRSLSAMTWAVRGQPSGFSLLRHNVFFDQHANSEFEDIFRHQRLPRHATVYVCAQDRFDTATASPGGERLLVLVNAPARGDSEAFNDAETQACQDRCQRLLQRCGLSLTLAASPQVVRRTPADFHRLFPGSGGALYGRASHGWMAQFRRPGACTAIPGLLLAGGSVHPGPGVPMAAMSGRLAAATLLAGLGSTSRSLRVRIDGGTSTPSATMAATR